MANLSARARSRIYASLEKYARSGMGIERACQSLLAQSKVGAAERRIYEGMLAGLGEGASIGESLRHAGTVVSPLEREVVSAAEAGGTLEKGFGHLAEYFRRVDRTRRHVLRGLTYPVILLHLAVPVSTLAVTVFRSFSLDGSASGSPFRDAFVNIGWTMLAVYVVGAVLVAGGLLLRRAGRRSAGVDSALNRIPLVGNARRFVALERFSRVFEIFLLAGAKMSDALLGAARASGSGLIREAGRSGADGIVAGDSLATALHAAPRAFPNEFARGVAAAEESGQLDREMAEWGRYYAESAREAMDRVGEWTPRLFYWAILLLVAYLVVRAGMAYRDLLENLLNLGF